MKREPSIRLKELDEVVSEQMLSSVGCEVTLLQLSPQSCESANTKNCDDRTAGDQDPTDDEKVERRPQEFHERNASGDQHQRGPPIRQHGSLIGKLRANGSEVGSRLLQTHV